MTRDPLQPRWLLRLRQRALVRRYAGGEPEFIVTQEEVVVAAARLSQRIRDNPLDDDARERFLKEIEGGVTRIMKGPL